MDDCRASVRVSTGARLHFGLLDTRAPFGGVGVMIDRPLTCVQVSSAKMFNAGAVQPERLTAIARRLSDRYLGHSCPGGLPPCKIRVVSAAPPHSGLGSGTQLALATATALATYFDLQLSRTELVASLADRGRRSAIGSLGFFEGGLIAEDGMTDDYVEIPHWRRLELPSAWRVVLARPRQFDQPVSGDAEGSAFASLAPAAEQSRAELASLGAELMSAAQHADFDAFASAVTRFNRSSGELFAAQQGGCYNGAAVSELVEHVQRCGARAYGQSSWGPIVFAFCPTAESAKVLSGQLGDRLVTIAKPRLMGAEIDISP